MIKSKIKLLSALLVLAVLGIQAAHAQTSDEVTLNVTLVAAQSISVNATQKTVTLTFDDATDYQNGVTSEQASHLEVSSTGLFQVKVNTSTEDLVYDDENNIPVSTVTVTPVYASGTDPDPDADATGVSLSTTATTILDSDDGTAQTFYNVTYFASGGADYINKSAGTYTTTVTYTISPD
ncbi:MAG: hypothetical protein AB2L24_21220 [Mangrovibacterium sp.]